MEENKKPTNPNLNLSGAGQIKKKSFWDKLSESFTGSDNQKIGDYIVFDVLIPAVKKTIQEIVTNGVDMLLYGETKDRSRSNLPASKVSYRSYYDSDRRNTERYSQLEYRTASYDDVMLNTYGDAQMVLESMRDVIEHYGFVKVADLYEFAKIPGASYTDNNYGWTDLRNADIVRQRSGMYWLKLPRPMPID